MSLPKLTVKYQGRYEVSYTSHYDYVCLTITNCPHWDLVTKVSWEGLHTNKFGIFYETETCHTGGKYFYISDVAKENGTHAFKSPQAIRSYMVGADNAYMRRPSRTVSNCDKERASVMVFGDAVNETTANSTSEVRLSDDGTGGLSSNWSDALPDA